RHTRFSRDWSSDVCSSDLAVQLRDVLWLGPTQLAGDEVAVVAIDGISGLVVALGLSRFLVGFAKARILDVGVDGVGQRTRKERRSEERRVGIDWWSGLAPY